jgi:hypothetical protein
VPEPEPLAGAVVSAVPFAARRLNRGVGEAEIKPTDRRV